MFISNTMEKEITHILNIIIGIEQKDVSTNLSLC